MIIFSFLFNVSLIELGPKSLQIVPNLEELFLDSCLQLKRVHSRAFAGLQTLRKMFVSFPIHLHFSFLEESQIVQIWCIGREQCYGKILDFKHCQLIDKFNQKKKNNFIKKNSAE